MRPGVLLALGAVGTAAYLGWWPVPIDPVAWQAPAAPGYTGAHAPNARLAGIKTIALDRQIGPEHIVAGRDGELYAGIADGLLLHMRPDGSSQGMLAYTGGRPLGMAFDAHGNLIVADADKGLLSFDANGARTVLLAAGEGGPVHFANAVAVAASGKIYLTDSSMRFLAPRAGSTQWAATLDVLEQSATGRVLEYDPASKAVRVVAKGLSFANGIVLAADEQSVFVSESGRYRVWRIDIAAAQLDVSRAARQAKVVLDNLPGYPDNLTRGLNGRIWLGLAGQRDELDAMAGQPFMRKLVLRIPRVFWPAPKRYGHVLAFTEAGQVVADLQDPSGASPVTTGATETVDRLYIHNVNGNGVGWLPSTAAVP
ncbi:strictosidine synthase [Massilia sp. Root351]|nr:strictosidine synthase [Massilia sp. Root351]